MLAANIVPGGEGPPHKRARSLPQGSLHLPTSPRAAPPAAAAAATRSPIASATPLPPIVTAAPSTAASVGAAPQPASATARGQSHPSPQQFPMTAPPLHYVPAQSRDLPPQQPPAAATSPQPTPAAAASPPGPAGLPSWPRASGHASTSGAALPRQGPTLFHSCSCTVYVFLMHRST